MKSICPLLMFAVETSALIINGTAETCGSTFCGYRAACRGQTCVCPGSYRLSATQAQYCIDSCATKDDCSKGTNCTENRLTLKRCYCDVDAGYVLSPLGNCSNILTTTQQSTGQDLSKRVPQTTDRQFPRTTATQDSTDLPLYIGLGVGIASFVLISIILVILIVFIRRRKRSRRSPASVSGEGGTVINNNLTKSTPNARGEGTNRYSESPVDLSDEFNVNLKGNPQKNPTYHHSATYEDIDNNFQTEGADLITRIPKKFDNSESNANEQSGLKEKQDLYSNHKIQDNKGKVIIFNLKTSTITEAGVGGKGSQTPAAKTTDGMENRTHFNGQDTNPYQTPYDATPFSTNQREETATNGKTLKVENNMNENPYSLAHPMDGAIGQNFKMEEQTYTEIENDYDELKRQVLSNTDK